MDRRLFVQSVSAAVGALGMMTCAAPAGAQTTSRGVSEVPAASGIRPLFFPDDLTFWYETLRCFSHIAYGGADFGEVAVTAQRITSGSYDSWHDEWRRTAEAVSAEALRSAQSGHKVSASDAYLRASNYYRSAEFFLHGRPDDPRIAAAYRQSVDCFRAALRMGRGTVEPVVIRYDGTTLPGYFYKGAGTARKLPTVVMHNGFDGSVEEMHFVAAVALAERGYNVLSFDGPGQPGPLHATRRLVLRPDWEHVIGPVLDYVQSQPDVDQQRIALLGNSMGGELAPRAAAFEPRIHALIALDGVFDMAAKVLPMFGGDREMARKALTARDAPEIDGALAQAANRDTQSRWAFSHGMWVTGAANARGYVATLLDYHLGGGVAERIQCPTLVCSGTSDEFFKGQPEELFSHLTCPKTMMTFDNTLGAGAHCQAGAQRLAMARIGDWLDVTL